MRMGLRALGLLAITWAWVPFVGCDAFDPPTPPDGTGGLLSVGGAQATGGSNGSGGRVSMPLCPPPYEDCCYEWAAAHSCHGDSVCKSYPLAIDCSRIECEPPCPFGCLDGQCLPDPSAASTGGLGGIGGEGGLGGEGGAP